MPFGKKGTPLGKLSPEELKYFVENFEVQTEVVVTGANGEDIRQPIPPESIAKQKALRAALDAAKANPKG